jgi:Ca2+-transporting ATPase
MPTVASETPAPSVAYRLHVSELIAILRTDGRRGLSDDEARARLAQYGLNELAPHKPVPAWRRFLSQFHDVLVILLLIATAISAALWALERDAALPYEAKAIFAVVLLNATMGYVQESRAEAAVAALRAMSAPDATVIRGPWAMCPSTASAPPWCPASVWDVTHVFGQMCYLCTRFVPLRRLTRR